MKQLIEQFNKPFLEPLAKQIGEPVTVTVTVTATVTNNVTDSEKENKAFDVDVIENMDDIQFEECKHCKGTGILNNGIHEYNCGFCYGTGETAK